ncbi:NAD(P)/FAD-dependent oxidoreductase [Phenylobacterium sp.]|uniref:NAD(P)/FAD-dependent oxidoreductase n=1 Tax=Phenylobacterium sp. TaxID=1871053 RepID=UPI0025FAAC5C|nr:NAD(P)/FAD-dependent oxidoreductase [Phenylobacterium sp.]MCA6286798.1 NAD(P)/FAD-dependent oxidoreductase [Phenylobacterium sp.]MCA6289893.1 NAD(P)/FAD-dependent oxidoreductase [Phenylobacterium sp.]MCA6311331.1 NAD(P)/FAD-dependent oxidoreductase [Phenylobacterium sp.]MCA6322416.1 NAD(P)/FAD-dependent oxidoreductase [Phenylobacterium sp.]MCA6338016.1 NAD(P)/FAD-dependent oxidoreductase [Phenylobacterium sp.]
MSGFDFDAVVVGAGAVGLACGYALALRGLSTVVLEAGPRIGEGVSARNSEVVHGGLYYPTGSLKARLCVQGRRSLYAFLAERGVAFDRCGKLVVFNGPEELERLDAILNQARTNDVEGMEVLTPAQVRALEPDLKCDAALLSPQSGVFDSHGYMLALQGEIESRGGAVVLSTPFEGAEPLATGGWRVSTGGDDPAVLTTARLVTAPGLDAQSVAGRISGLPSGTIPQGFFGKGVYFRLTGRAPFSRLVYPPPIPGALGTHYRRDLGGQAVFGPDLEFVPAPDYEVDPGRAGAFYDCIRTFWPDLPDGALQPDYAGVRPKLHGPGQPQPDFRIDGPEVHGLDGLVALFGIESPGLTSSLAIGEEVADRLGL